ncbi:LysM domain-containing protein [Facklamia sp. 7083-14-GEN3]|uniref:LysM peptidoglycan-binding domain-containing protein n=1 Tax=Facklamia sp. 7083-14-GEN3 TaxID=2973478 RepID=UPI00215C7E6B|nr:LysM peptidoglycan-binding domain-containing protein [Facklamia sp. 7083-14-GEN3]MCR8969563.1 LysM peptidoglycan-binding domain-containing protein [Facklamia sp. 7083-14-GEN3]
MKFNKKVSLGASLMLMLTPVAITSAQNWNARTVEEISAELTVNEDNQMTYIVKYGDTLGAIAEAMDIDLDFLAAANQIENVNLIYPETKLVAQYDINHKAEKLNVETSAGETFEMDIPVSLTPEAETEDQQVVFEKEPEVEEIILNVSEAEDFEVEQELPIAEETIQVEEVVETTAELVNEIPPVEEEVLADEIVETTIEEVSTTQEATVSPVIENEEPNESIAEETIQVEEAVEAEDVELETTQSSVVELENVIEEVEQSEELTESTVTTKDIIEEVVKVEETPVTEELVGDVNEEVTTNYSIPSTLAGVSQSAANYGSRIANQYGVTAYGLRPGDSGDHGRGLAVDFMVPVGSALGDQIAADAIANMGNNNIAYVIWKQQIYGNWTGGQWQPMEDRGSVTQNHYDHVHVSFNN